MAKRAEFEDLLSLPALHEFVEVAGFNHPTAVQQAAIPLFLSGKSVSVLAQTGSGKTLAYALPIVEMLKDQEELAVSDCNSGPDSPSGPLERAPRAWVVCPTRELGTQIEKVFKSIAHLAKLRVRHLKGSARSKQSRMARSGPIDVLIASPNRALVALRNGELKAEATRFLVFDEADQLFDRGFLPDVRALATRLGSGHLQVGLFSATRPGTFAELRKECFPTVAFDELTLQGSHTLRDNIATRNYTVPFKDKSAHAVTLLGKAVGPGFVFVNLKRTATMVFEQLCAALPDKRISLLHGGLDKKDRRKVLAQFADGGDLLVCTDIAARGLDLLNANWVINYDLPFEPVYYMHRCGRVGRTGRPALIHNLVTTKDRPLIARINTAIANQASLKLSRVVEKRDRDAEKPKGGKSPGRSKTRGVARPKVAGVKRGGAGKTPNKRVGANKTAAERPTATVATGSKTTRAKPPSKRPTSRKAAGAKWARNKPGPTGRKGR